MPFQNIWHMQEDSGIRTASSWTLCLYNRSLVQSNDRPLPQPHCTLLTCTLLTVNTVHCTSSRLLIMQSTGSRLWTENAMSTDSLLPRRTHRRKHHGRLHEALASWHLQEEQIVYITTNNGPNVVNTTELNHWVRLQCFGHKLNLAIGKCKWMLLLYLAFL